MLNLSVKILTQEILNCISKEISRKLFGRASVNRNEGDDVAQALPYLAISDIVRRDMILNQFDNIVYTEFDSILEIRNILEPFQVYCATNLNFLLYLTAKLEEMRKGIVYFNGFDQTNVCERVESLNIHNMLMAAIWICLAERPHLKEAALYHVIRENSRENHEINLRLDANETDFGQLHE